MCNSNHAKANGACCCLQTAKKGFHCGTEKEMENQKKLEQARELRDFKSGKPQTKEEEGGKEADPKNPAGGENSPNHGE